jgi:hypothetical protein
MQHARTAAMKRANNARATCNRRDNTAFSERWISPPIRIGGKFVHFE